MLEPECVLNGFLALRKKKNSTDARCPEWVKEKSTLRTGPIQLHFWPGMWVPTCSVTFVFTHTCTQIAKVSCRPPLRFGLYHPSTCVCVLLKLVHTDSDSFTKMTLLLLPSRCSNSTHILLLIVLNSTLHQKHASKCSVLWNQHWEQLKVLSGCEVVKNNQDQVLLNTDGVPSLVCEAGGTWKKRGL